MRAQASGLARVLGGILDAEVAEKTVPLRADEAPPDVAVSCGSAAVFSALRLKFRHGTFIVHTQRPFFGAALFDAVVRARHDGVGGANSLAITGSVGPVSAAALKARRESALRRFGNPPRPRVGVLLGGANRAFEFNMRECARIRESVLRLRDKTGGSVLAAASRRTGDDNAKVMKDLIWEDELGNPYLDILAAADILAVSGDSVNMLSEACAAGRPVLIFPPTVRGGWRGQRAAAKFLAFHRELNERGLAQAWDDSNENPPDWENWETPPLDETVRAAQWLVNRIQRTEDRGQ